MPIAPALLPHCHRKSTSYQLKRAITFDCREVMPLKEDLSLHHLDRETPSFVKVGKV
jgi:hypothetical protein